VFYELQHLALLKQLNDLMYCKEQGLMAEEKKRLAQEAELKRRRETLGTWEHYKARCEEADRRAGEADVGVRPLRHGHRHDRRQVISHLSYFRNITIHCNTCLKGLMSAFVTFLLL
jgi:hypothetical protein